MQHSRKLQERCVDELSELSYIVRCWVELTESPMGQVNISQELRDSVSSLSNLVENALDLALEGDVETVSLFVKRISEVGKGIVETSSLELLANLWLNEVEQEEAGFGEEDEA